MEQIHIIKKEKYIEKGKSIHIFEYCTAHTDRVHTHEFIEIVYARSGNACEVVDGVEYPVRHGDMIFMNYGSTHRTLVKEGSYSYVTICFSPEVVGQTIITSENAFALLSLTAFNEMRSEAGGGRISFDVKERQTIERLLEDMLHEEQIKQTSWDRIMENYLNILITKMLRKTEYGSKRQEQEEVWQELAEYIEGNPDADLTLATLAKKCFYNPSYFSRVFKEKFGMSLVEYVNRKRIDNAVRLLCESEMSVDEILTKVGFSDRSNFYRVFSKFMGSTPADIRKQNKKQNV